MSQQLQGFCKVCDIQLQLTYNGNKWICNNCKQKFGANQVPRYRCNQHDFDFCNSCASNSQSKGILIKAKCGKCQNNLKYSQRGRRWRCDDCNRILEGSVQNERYRCDDCDFDLCEKCNYNRIQILKQNQYYNNNNQFQQVQQSSNLQKGRCASCFNNLFYRNDNQQWFCNNCFVSYQGYQNQGHYSCQKDNFNLCNICVETPCFSLKKGFCGMCRSCLQYNNKVGRWSCDKCKQKFNSVEKTHRYRCQIHDFDLCSNCANLDQQSINNQSINNLQQQMGNISINHQQNNYNQSQQQQQFINHGYQYNQPQNYININQQQNQQYKEPVKIQIQLGNQQQNFNNVTVSGQYQNQVNQQQDKQQNTNTNNTIQNNNTNKQDDDDKYTCKICFDKPSQYLNPQCGHLAICEDCVKEIKNQCPVCRKEGNFIKVFV